MVDARAKIAFVGHHTWFSGHFPEGWETDPNVLCLNVNEGHYRFLIHLINFRPDITVFYRPELYPRRYLEQVTGRKIAFLSEPVPLFVDGKFDLSSETRLRLQVYKGMQWDIFDRIFYYDRSKSTAIEALGWPVSDFRPIPIDTSLFRSDEYSRRTTDVFFIGKPTPHRIQQMDFLRTMQVNFRWIAHGCSGADLAQELRRSRVVLNIHADGRPALEPRIHLAAACGCVVLSEPLDGDISPFQDRVFQYSGDLNHKLIEGALGYSKTSDFDGLDTNDLSVRKFIAACSEGYL